MASIGLLYIIPFYWRFILNIRTDMQKLPYVFLVEFRIGHCNTNFIPLFPSVYKTHHIYASCHDQTSVSSKLCWVNIIAVYKFYRWLFSSAPCLEVLEYWSQAILLRLRVINTFKCWNYYQSCCRGCFLHMIIKLKRETYLSDIPLKCRKFQTIF